VTNNFTSTLLALFIVVVGGTILFSLDLQDFSSLPLDIKIGASYFFTLVIVGFLYFIQGKTVRGNE